MSQLKTLSVTISHPGASLSFKYTWGGSPGDALINGETVSSDTTEKVLKLPIMQGSGNRWFSLYVENQGPVNAIYHFSVVVEENMPEISIRFNEAGTPFVVDGRACCKMAALPTYFG